MWDCLLCGVQAIVADLEKCPGCQAVRGTEKPAAVPAEAAVSLPEAESVVPGDPAAPYALEDATVDVAEDPADDVTEPVADTPEPQVITGSGGIKLPQLGVTNG